MEEEPGGSEPDVPHPGSAANPLTLRPRPARLRHAAWLAMGALLVASPLFIPDSSAAEDALTRVRQAGRLAYGADAEGGGPYAYPDPDNPRQLTGFEVELMDLLTGALGPRPVLVQGQWDTLLPVLESGRIDLVVNGYELTPARAERYLATRPYYVFQLQVMVRQGSAIASWDDLCHPKPGGGRWRLGVLGGSTAETFARQGAGETVEVQYFNGATDAMMAVNNGQMDATLQDLPAARFYRKDYPGLALVGPPVGLGHYVIYLRHGDEALRDALDQGIVLLIQSGQLRRLLEKYDIWTDKQTSLKLGAPGGSELATQETLRGWPLLARYGPTLIQAAGMTVLLSVTSMPLAMALGLFIALGRLYGPGALRLVLGMYVELIRGTPLMLQLFALFFLLPKLNIALPPLAAGIIGLAINYSAYEAEIYRAGLQAIPSGQMEAALALGMSRGLALRRIIVPQAARIVIPPVTNDFIALFKDTSVCSVITLVELTKQYSILANSTGGVVEFAVAASVLYLAMSLPLSWLSRWSEQRSGPLGRKGTLA
ncbi:MAG: ABC transporter permease subunit [Isosphaeraceae bacterium]